MFTRMQGRVFHFFVLTLLLSGCQSVPLSNSPYQQIVKKYPHKNQFLVRIQSRLEPALNQPGAPISRMPNKEEIQRIVCESLVKTRFQCISDEKPNLRPDYIVYVATVPFVTHSYETKFDQLAAAYAEEGLAITIRVERMFTFFNGGSR